MLNFKDEYKSAMDDRKPSEQSIRKMRIAIAELKSKPEKGRFALRKLMPLAACLVVVVALSVTLSNTLLNNKASLAGQNSSNSTNTDGGTNAPAQKVVPPLPSGFQTTSPQATAQPTPSGSSENGTAAATPKPSIPAGADYSSLYGVISELQAKYGGVRTYDSKSAEISSAPMPSAAPTTGAAAGAVNGTSQSHSDTNIQVAGVDESDVVKTDGNYIYTLSGEKLYIVRAEDGKLTKVSELKRTVNDGDSQQMAYATEMYVEGDRLTVLRTVYQYHIMSQPATDTKSAYIYPVYSKSFIRADIYDITDRSSPKLLNTFSQDGSYTSSRMIGGVLYLITNNYVSGEINKDKPETFVPQVYNGSQGALIAPSDITISVDPKTSSGSAQFIVVSGIDTSGSGKLVSDKAVLGYGSQIYANQSNLYVASYSNITDGSTYTGATKLIRFSLDNGKIEYKSEGTVPGSILNQFSMDEYNGVFRIVTTVNTYSYVVGTTTPKSSVGSSGAATGSASAAAPSPVPTAAPGGVTTPAIRPQSSQYNNLYTLDSDLKIIGKIEKIAEGERVYSVRFDGDIGYFVTFRQVDPLFAVDLSDATNPAVLSALKIPGFSQYLHPYSDGLLFGFGNDADISSGRTGGLKLSMFNVSDPKNVTEANKLVIDGFYYSNASYNHKAILVDGQKNLIAFPTEGYYLIYSYSRDNGFKLLAKITTDSNKYSYNMRGLYIGSYFYVISDGGISSYSMDYYNNVSTLKF